MGNNNKTTIRSEILLLAESALVGILAGLFAVLYRYLLTWAESGLGFVLDQIRGNIFSILLWFAALLIMGCAVGFLMRWEGMAAGSGIPQVAGELKGQLDPCWWRVLIAKIAGGTVSIFGGLSLGREGPSIQLGAMAAKGYSRFRGPSKSDELIYISCGAGAGLAAAFNAPFAGVLFVLEELHHAFDRRLLTASMIAAVFADFVSKMFFGQAAVFSYQTTTIPLNQYWLLLLFGVIVGLAGAGYNYVMVHVQKFYQSLKKIPGELRIASAFLIAGVLGLWLPQVLAGGHSMVLLLEKGHPALSFMVLLLAVKFIFSSISFGSGAPGGIFFPLLVLGSYIGAIYGDIVLSVLPVSEDIWVQFIILGMAGLFASITRASLTGVVLITEMTGNMHRLLDIAVVCIISYAVANILKSEPIYDSLLDNILARQKKET